MSSVYSELVLAVSTIHFVSSLGQMQHLGNGFFLKLFLSIYRQISFQICLEVSRIVVRTTVSSISVIFQTRAGLQNKSSDEWLNRMQFCMSTYFCVSILSSFVASSSCWQFARTVFCLEVELDCSQQYQKLQTCCFQTESSFDF